MKILLRVPKAFCLFFQFFPVWYTCLAFSRLSGNIFLTRLTRLTILTILTRKQKSFRMPADICKIRSDRTIHLLIIIIIIIIIIINCVHPFFMKFAIFGHVHQLIGRSLVTEFLGVVLGPIKDYARVRV